jgi:hypothetical protein
MLIQHAPGGVRVVRVERPDHVVIVTNRAGHGYIERPYVFHNMAVVQRTYYVSGVPYHRFYRPYSYRGVPLVVYAPARYYTPAYYGWAYRPWPAPVRYNWVAARNPWNAYYGGYFVAEPAYASPSLWLTDYMVASTLQSGYQERLDASGGAVLPPNNYSATPLSPVAKQAIAVEVQRQIALENAEAGKAAQGPADPASSSIARMMSDNSSHAFLVSSPLDVPSGNSECSITEGDVLQLANAPPIDATTASVVVLASKGQDCPKGSVVTVSFADLQDMQNHMRATIDQGLAELQSAQGKGDIPAAPVTALAAPVQTSFAEAAPPQESDATTELQQQAQAAEAAETAALTQAELPQIAASPPTVVPQGTHAVLANATEDVVIHIADGSSIRGQVFGDTLQYQSAIGTQTFAMRDVVQFANGTLRLRDQTILKGRLAGTVLRVKTAASQILRIPVAQIVGIDPAEAPPAPPPENNASLAAGTALPSPDAAPLAPPPVAYANPFDSLTSTAIDGSSFEPIAREFTSRSSVVWLAIKRVLSEDGDRITWSDEQGRLLVAEAVHGVSILRTSDHYYFWIDTATAGVTRVRFLLTRHGLSGDHQAYTSPHPTGRTRNESEAFLDRISKAVAS